MKQVNKFIRNKIKKTLPFLSLYLYISSLFSLFFEQKKKKNNPETERISETPEENFFFLFVFCVSIFVFIQAFMCRANQNTFHPPVLSLKHHKSNKWNIVFFLNKKKTNKNKIMLEDIQKKKNYIFWDHLISCYVR